MRLAPAPFLCSGAFIALSVGHVQALNLQFSRRAVNAYYNAPSQPIPGFYNLTSSEGSYALAASVGNGPASLGNVGNIRYTTNITLNGKEFHVALDTGSTDIWVVPPSDFGTFNDSGIPLKLGYGDGSYGVEGTIGVASFEFGNYKIERQAFLHVQKSTVSKMHELGINGLLGLSFNVREASPINNAVQQLYGEGATWGHSALQNIFDQHPDQPNYLAIDLARTHDWEETDGGSFGIGEVEEKYAAVLNAPKIPQYPKGGSRWTILLEGIKVDGSPVELKSKIPGVPAGSLQAMLDTGDPAALIPTSLRDAIYSKIPGAIVVDQDDGTKVWIIPCNSTANVVLTFGGQEFPIHPLDLSNIRQLETGDNAYSFCSASWFGVDEWAGNDFEVSLGDNFLRNVYSVYDFGDPKPDGSAGEPYIQLLAQTDPAKAPPQVPVIRAETMKDFPPEIDTADFLALLQADLGSTASAANGTKSVVYSTTKPTATGNSEASNDVPSLVAASTGPYGPVIIALLSANLIVTIIVAVFAVLNYMRRGKSSTSSYGKSGPIYVPVQTDGYKA